MSRALFALRAILGAVAVFLVTDQALLVVMAERPAGMMAGRIIGDEREEMMVLKGATAITKRR